MTDQQSATRVRVRHDDADPRRARSGHAGGPAGAHDTDPVAPRPGDGGGGDPIDGDDRGGGDGDGDGGAPRRRRRRPERSLVIMSLVVAIGLAFVVRGVLAGVTGDDRSDLPDLVESVVPVPDSVQVLSQSNVFVDLAADHVGVLVIDGVELETVDVGELGSIEVEPGQQVDLPPVTIYEPGNATLTFTPGPDAPIEEFSSGVHQVQVIYWRIGEGRQRARTYTWTFNVV